MKEKLDHRFWLTHLILPVALFAAAAAACELTDVDLTLADRYFDFARGVWPLRDAWWADWLIHQRGRDLIACIGGGALAGWLASWFSGRFKANRWRLFYLALVIGLTAVAVAGLKKATHRNCPWDIDRYGGSAPYTRLTEPPPQACGPGNCFPAGHASGGFSLFAGYFAWRDRKRRLAKAWLAAGGLLGSVYGWTQMVRGAHFLSHNVWSAIICWLMALLVYLLMRRVLARE
jgi:membrane-associated PAP2 superfamily phosphatase